MKVYVNWDERIIYSQEDYNNEIRDTTEVYVASGHKFNNFIQNETSFTPNDIFHMSIDEKDALNRDFVNYCYNLAMDEAEASFQEFDI